MINAVRDVARRDPDVLPRAQAARAWLSLAAAALTVAIPSMLYTGTLMTENAFYPVFVLAALAARADARAADGDAGRCCCSRSAGSAFATRAQAIALFGAALVAPFVHGLIERDAGRVPAPLRDALRADRRRRRAGAGRHASPAAARRSRCSAPTAPRPTAATRSPRSARYLLWHVAELDLALGVVGFAALIAMWLSPRSTSAGARAFAAASLSITVLLVLEVAAFASMQSFRIEERNDFYVAPVRR